MKTLFKNLLTLGLTTVLATGSLLAADIKERTFKFSYVQPKDSHMGFGAQKFADLVSKKSGGKLTVRVFPNGTLGGDLQTVSALQGGTVEITTMPPSLLAGLSKEFGAFDLPFLFNDFREADAVLDGPIGKRFMERLPAGLVGLSYWDHGFRNVSNSKRPIARVEDLQGLKLRVVQTPLMVDTFKGLGTNAVPMAFTELYTAMESKAVDGQDNPVVAFETNRFYEVQKHLSLTRHVYNPLIVLFSQKVWDKLSQDERQILQEAARETSVEQRRVSRDMEAKALDKARSQGTVVTDITPQERQRLRDRVKPVTEQYTRELGEPLVKEILGEIDKVRTRL